VDRLAQGAGVVVMQQAVLLMGVTSHAPFYMAAVSPAAAQRDLQFLPGGRDTLQVYRLPSELSSDVYAELLQYVFAPAAKSKSAQTRKNKAFLRAIEAAGGVPFLEEK
jgi:hypothetical protein